VYADPVVDQYRLMLRLQAAALRLGRRAWRNVRADDLSGSWSYEVARFLPAMVAAQTDAAFAGATYVAESLDSMGSYVAPVAAVQYKSLAGVASDGRPLESLLYSPVTGVKSLISQGVAPRDALAGGLKLLERNISTTLADTARTASGIDIAVRPQVGYVRMLNPPSCSRCTVLAGRYYKWNAGFQRHPKCDCIQQPAKGVDAARSEGLISDPYEYFNGLSEAEQDKAFTKAGAQAIRDGADISQVVNARRGMYTTQGGLVATREGVTKRGYFGAQQAEFKKAQGSKYSQARTARVMPETIYQLAGSREEALRMLKQYGYITDQGQVIAPIRGEGFGFSGGGKNRLGY